MQENCVNASVVCSHATDSSVWADNKVFSSHTRYITCFYVGCIFYMIHQSLYSSFVNSHPGSLQLHMGKVESSPFYLLELYQVELCFSQYPFHIGNFSLFSGNEPYNHICGKVTSHGTLSFNFKNEWCRKLGCRGIRDTLLVYNHSRVQSAY